MKNKFGNINVLIVGGIMVAGLGLAFLARQLPQLQSVERHSDELVQYQAVLSSAVSYATHAVRERWCLTPNFTQGGCSTDLAVWRTDSLNTSRLLISDKQISDPRFLATLKLTSSEAAALQLGTVARPFSVIVKLREISARHPLYIATQALKDQRLYDSIQIDIDRISNLHLPMGGDEIFLNVKASLLSSTTLARTYCVQKVCPSGKSSCKEEDKIDRFTHSLFCRGSRLYSESVIGFFPRELDGFALVVARDMRLDRSGSGLVGDFQVPPLRSKSDLAQGSNGLLFTSPVFVNGNLILPASLAVGGSGDYSATTFGDRLILGEGSVLEVRNGIPAPVAPATSGGLSSQLYAQMSAQFGGILQGVNRDGVADRGLQYLFKINPGIVPDSGLMAQCIERNRVQTDLSYTSQSHLGIKATGSVQPVNDGTFTYRLALSRKNRFVEQSVTPAILNSASGVVAEMTQAEGMMPLAILGIDFPFASGTSTLSATVSRESKIEIIVKDPDDSRGLAALSSRLTIQMARVRIGGNIQPDQIDMSISFKDGANMKTAPRVTVKAYEAGSDGRGGLRSVLPMVSNEALLEFRKIGTGSLIAPPSHINSLNFETANPVGSVAIASAIMPSGIDATAIDRQCVSVVSQASVDTDFAPYARSSWLFRPIVASDRWEFNLASFDAASLTDKKQQITNALEQLLGNGSGTVGYVDAIISMVASRTASSVGDINISYNESICYLQQTKSLARTLIMSGKEYQKAGLTEIIQVDKVSKWPVYTMINDSSTGAIAGECVIGSSANFVTGFYVCDRLVIESRRTPLRIIGSFIVGSTLIDSSAIKAGITWSSIFNRQAIAELMEVGRLGAGVSCTSSAVPVWQPASAEEESRRKLCNPMLLRTAEPFQWTTVDPDCALLSGGASTICKRLIKRYTVKVISSGGSI